MIKYNDYSVIWWPLQQALSNFCKRHNVPIKVVCWERRSDHYHIWAETNEAKN